MDTASLPPSSWLLSQENLTVRVDGREVLLTPTQFRFLQLFVKNLGKIFSRAELVAQGIGTRVTDRTVDVHIKDLRRRLGTHGGRIETVRGQGYRLTQASGDGA